jgi:Chemotaxis phosphatase CheX
MPQQIEPMAESSAELEILDRVGAEVMETMFFSEAVASHCSHEWMGAAVGARVRFSGTHDGEFLVSVSQEAAQSVAAGFLGLDTIELAPAQLSQVILELANILCGAAMSHLWPESALALEAPELADPCDAIETGCHRCFTLPEGMLAVTIRMATGDEPAKALPVPEGNAA